MIQSYSGILILRQLRKSWSNTPSNRRLHRHAGQTQLPSTWEPKGNNSREGERCSSVGSSQEWPRQQTGLQRTFPLYRVQRGHGPARRVRSSEWSPELGFVSCYHSRHVHQVSGEELCTFSVDKCVSTEWFVTASVRKASPHVSVHLGDLDVSLQNS